MFGKLKESKKVKSIIYIIFNNFCTMFVNMEGE